MSGKTDPNDLLTGDDEEDMVDGPVQRKVQSQGRIDIPDDWLEELGLNESRSVLLSLDVEDGEISIKNLKKVIENAD